MTLRRNLKVGALVGLGCAALMSGMAQADGDGAELTGVYKDRHEVMEGFKGVAQSTGGMLKGKTEFDLAKVKEGGAYVASHSGEALLALFPEGSNEGDSEALDKIWEDWAGFTEAANVLETRAAALAAAEDQAQAGAAFGAMMQACGGCHKPYRVKK